MAPSPKRLKMSPSTDRKRAVRIAGCSGGFTDRSTAIARMASDPDVDVVMGSTLSLPLLVSKSPNLVVSTQVTGFLK